MDFDLTKEQKMIRDEVRNFAKKEIAPQAEELDRTGEYPYEIYAKMAELGLMGIPISEAYGGMGSDWVSLHLAIEELSRADLTFGAMIDVTTSVVAQELEVFGTEEQKQEWLVPIATGEKLGAFGLTEPDYGSDPGGMKSRARKVDGGYELTGTKMWISNSPIADVFIVWAKNDDGRVRGFILDKGMDGLSAPKIEGKLSLRTSVTGEIVMDSVFVPEENLLPNTEGLKGPMGCLNNARYGIAWGALGAAEACWHAAREYVLDRKQFGRPLAANQLIQKKLADMQTEIGLGLQGWPPQGQ